MIPLRVANQTAYVWDVDDIATIRADHHICGVLSGTLPHLSQQNMFLGVPLVLMPEEVVLLVEIGTSKQVIHRIIANSFLFRFPGAAAIVDDPIAHISPTPTQLRKWSRDQQSSVRSQLAFIESKTAKEGLQHGRAMSTEAIRKRKEREERRRKAATAKAAKDAADAHEADVEDEDGEGNGEDITPNLPYTISISASSSSLEWYSPNQVLATHATLSSAREAGVWTYPSTLAERARCGVFKDLWKQGYFMGGGIKFGGEYLVYPGKL